MILNVMAALALASVLAGGVGARRRSWNAGLGIAVVGCAIDAWGLFVYTVLPDPHQWPLRIGAVMVLTPCSYMALRYALRPGLPATSSWRPARPVAGWLTRCVVPAGSATLTWALHPGHWSASGLVSEVLVLLCMTGVVWIATMERAAGVV